MADKILSAEALKSVFREYEICGELMIDEIIDIIDKIPTLKPKWHNFKDEKPTKDGLYIVYADGSLWGRPVVGQAEYYGGEWIWYEMADDYYITSMVSHWMPLPKPPEVEK